ncbi:uncharacterized protein LOC128238229 [Mya arenaria]|uniref:uncharacterized protein LOC128238229 n=1 Tax=Mya arenaria TaxID=6604 RepID=UPI0022E16E4D|nr:uncharacterized protein LOC128238229 [Mya arenaria]
MKLRRIIKYDVICMILEAKVDDEMHPTYVPTLFPRNSAKQGQTKTASLAGTFTPSPQTVSTKKRGQPWSQSTVGRPSSPKKLNCFTQDSEKVVLNSDHDYVKPKTKHEQEDTVESLKQENHEIKSKQLRLENIKGNAGKNQFWTNLPKYKVFQARCKYLKTWIDGGIL